MLSWQLRHCPATCVPSSCHFQVEKINKKIEMETLFMFLIHLPILLPLCLQGPFILEKLAKSMHTFGAHLPRQQLCTEIVHTSVLSLPLPSTSGCLPRNSQHRAGEVSQLHLWPTNEKQVSVFLSAFL